MENIKFVHIVILSITQLMALFAGWLLTETKHRLAEKHWLLNRKPFSCRPCLTFHFGWILAGMVAFYINNLFYFIIGTAISLGVWLVLEIDNRSKIDK